MYTNLFIFGNCIFFFVQIAFKNATVTSFLSNENNEEGNNEALDYSNASSKDKKASLSLSRKRDSGIPVPTNQKEFINRPVSV